MKLGVVIALIAGLIAAIYLFWVIGFGAVGAGIGELFGEGLARLIESGGP